MIAFFNFTKVNAARRRALSGPMAHKRRRNMQIWTIWGRKTNGNVVKCFTWRGERSAGLQRAYMEAKDWDYGLAYCWAEKVI